MNAKLIGSNQVAITVDVAVYTIGQLAALPTTQQFLGVQDANSVLAAVENIDGADVSALGARLSGVYIAAASEILFNRPGREVVIAPQPVAGTAKVSLSGGLITKTLPIMVGETTIEDLVLCQAIKALSGKTEQELRNSRITVNGVEASLTSTVASGETICVEPRVAGCKGATVTVSTWDGDEINVVIPENATLANVVSLINASGRVSGSVTLESVAAVEDTEFGDLGGSRFANMVICDGDTIELNDEHEVREDVEADCPTNCPGCPGNQASTAATATPASVGAVKVVLQSGMVTLTVAVIAGETTLNNVLSSNKVQQQGAQTVSDMSRSRVTVDGVETTNMSYLVQPGQTIRVDARAAGCKGN